MITPNPPCHVSHLIIFTRSPKAWASYKFMEMRKISLRSVSSFSLSCPGSVEERKQFARLINKHSVATVISHPHLNIRYPAVTRECRPMRNNGKWEKWFRENDSHLRPKREISERDRLKLSQLMNGLCMRRKEINKLILMLEHHQLKYFMA